MGEASLYGSSCYLLALVFVGSVEAWYLLDLVFVVVFAALNNVISVVDAIQR